MSVLEALDLASAVARLLALLAAPVFFAYSGASWIRGDTQKATLLIGYAVFLQVSGSC